MSLLALVIAVFICLNQINCEWKLIWKDDFNDPDYTKENWIWENEITICNGNYVDQLNCNTYDNIIVNNSKLSIKAVNKNHSNKRFTAGKLTTRESFSYGKYEIKASLPVGKLLRPEIYLLPKDVEPSEWKINGRIELMSNLQNSSIYPGIIHDDSLETIDFETNKNLNEFNIYTLEWNSREIVWIFNNECYYFKFDLNRIAPVYKRPGQPFDGSFKLIISLGVGGKNWFEPNELTNNEARNWTEPNFIIDYVRFYNDTDSNTIKTNYRSCKLSSVEVKNSCNGISIASILLSFINLLINKILLDYIMKLC